MDLDVPVFGRRSRIRFDLGGRPLPTRGSTRLYGLLWLRRLDTAFARLFGFAATARRSARAHVVTFFVGRLNDVLDRVDVVLESLENLSV